MGRALLFVDVRSLYYATYHRGQGCKLNYKTFLELCRQRHSDLVIARAYCSFSDATVSAKFVDTVRRIGFDVKEFTPDIDAQGTSHAPPNFYVSFTTDLICSIIDDEEIDTAIIATENVQFVPPIQWAGQEVSTELWTFSEPPAVLKNAVGPKGQTFRIPPECLFQGSKTPRAGNRSQLPTPV